MPPGSDWALICPDRVIDRLDADATLWIKRASTPPDMISRFTVPYADVEAADGFFFEVFGRAVDEPTTPLYWHLTPAAGLELGLTVEVWWHEIPIGASLRALHVFEALTGTMRKSVEVIGDDWEWDVARITRGLRALDMTVVRPGPKPGTGARFKTRADWLKAIRERVLPRHSLNTADDDAIAAWLNISRSKLFELMKRWPPPRTLEDLREGRF